MKCIEKISNSEQMCAENIIKFQKDLENYADKFRNQIQSELCVMSNEFKKEFCKNSEIMTNSWDQILASYKNDMLENIKFNFEQTMENNKRDINIELHKFNQKFKEKLNIISEDKLKSVTEQLDIAIQDEINLVKSRVNKDYKEININTSTNKPQSKLCTECLERKLHPG